MRRGSAIVPPLHVDFERADIDPSVTLAHEVIGDLDTSFGARRARRRIVTRGPETLAEHRRAFQPRCGRDRRLLRRTTPSTSFAGCCRATACSLSTSAPTRTRSQASGPRMRTRTFLITNGWSSMGFGLPAAIAAKLARPDLPVVCFVGDGCFQMTCGELAVAKRWGSRSRSWCSTTDG